MIDGLIAHVDKQSSSLLQSLSLLQLWFGNPRYFISSCKDISKPVQVELRCTKELAGQSNVVGMDYGLIRMGLDIFRALMLNSQLLLPAGWSSLAKYPSLDRRRYQLLICEVWFPDGSPGIVLYTYLSHPWGSAPSYTLPVYMLEISFVEPGYRL